MRRVLPFVTAVAMTAGLAQFAAAQNPPSPPPPTEQPSTPPATTATQPSSPSSMATDQRSQKMTGELLSVDPTTKMLTIKASDGREAKFSYTDKTEISGVKEQAAGLATAAGSKVTVEYTGSGDSMTATKIKVQGMSKHSKTDTNPGTTTVPPSPQSPQ
jgi:hypothetical protein